MEVDYQGLINNMTYGHDDLSMKKEEFNNILNHTNIGLLIKPKFRKTIKLLKNKSL